MRLLLGFSQRHPLTIQDRTRKVNMFIKDRPFVDGESLDE